MKYKRILTFSGPKAEEGDMTSSCFLHIEFRKWLSTSAIGIIIVYTDENKRIKSFLDLKPEVGGYTKNQLPLAKPERRWYTKEISVNTNVYK